MIVLSLRLQCAAMLHQPFGFENAGGSNDAGDQFRRSDVKAGIEGAASRIGHPNIGATAGWRSSPSTANFLGAAILNGNALSPLSLSQSNVDKGMAA